MRRGKIDEQMESFREEEERKSNRKKEKNVKGLRQGIDFVHYTRKLPTRLWEPDGSEK